MKCAPKRALQYIMMLTLVRTRTSELSRRNPCTQTHRVHGARLVGVIAGVVLSKSVVDWLYSTGRFVFEAEESRMEITQDCSRSKSCA